VKFDKTTVEYTARLARMSLSDAEAASLAGQLGNILKYVEKLNKVNTADVQPTSHVLPLKNVYRNDQMRPSLSAAEALANAPNKEGDFFKVPKIIE
jgi:aspartyl-tRNA(Asn)/glutamyl-tRNA(Gln) amidotransferase subunit C